MVAQCCPAWLCQGGDSRSEIGCLCIQPAQQHSPLTTGSPWALGLSAADWPGDVPRVSALRAFVLCALEIPSQCGFPQKPSPMVSETLAPAPFGVLTALRVGAVAVALWCCQRSIPHMVLLEFQPFTCMCQVVFKGPFLLEAVLVPSPCHLIPCPALYASRM